MREPGLRPARLPSPVAPFPVKSLVYIASTGYSGSTLLESILGTNEGCLNLGEICKLRFWPVCSCGAKVADCNFWTGLEKQLQNRPDGAGSRLQDWHVQIKRSRSGIAKLLHDAFIVAGCPGTLELFKALSREIRDFSDGSRRALTLFETAARHTGARVIVDSSKDPVLLKHLYALAPERLRLIHLVRDPRAVAHSFVKNFARDGVTYGSEDSQQAPSASQAAEYWRSRNVNIERTAWRIPSHQQLLIRYEDLCLEREASAEALSEFLGEEIRIPETLRLRQQHTLAGNPMRLTQDHIEVRLNQEWNSRLSAQDEAVILKATGALARRYGYSL